MLSRSPSSDIQSVSPQWGQTIGSNGRIGRLIEERIPDVRAPAANAIPQGQLAARTGGGNV
jgi:hypothetical protein